MIEENFLMFLKMSKRYRNYQMAEENSCSNSKKIILLKNQLNTADLKYWVVFVVFIIIIKQIVFFWYDCYRRWQGKETQLRSQSFILGDTIQKLTPLPRTGMFSKIWRAILVEVAGPKAPHSMIPKTLHLLRTIIHLYKTPPSRGHVL